MGIWVGVTLVATAAGGRCASERRHALIPSELGRTAGAGSSTVAMAVRGTDMPPDAAGEQRRRRCEEKSRSGGTVLPNARATARCGAGWVHGGRVHADRSRDRQAGQRAGRAPAADAADRRAGRADGCTGAAGGRADRADLAAHSVGSGMPAQQRRYRDQLSDARAEESAPRPGGASSAAGTPLPDQNVEQGLADPRFAPP